MKITINPLILKNLWCFLLCLHNAPFKRYFLLVCYEMLIVQNLQKAKESNHSVSRLTAFVFHSSARYSKPVMSSIPKKDIREDMRVEIFCNASGGYPAGVIHWYDQYNTNWTRSADTDVVQTEDKLFNLTSKLTVLQASSDSLGYRCVVLNSNRQQEEVAEYNLPFDDGGLTLSWETGDMLYGSAKRQTITLSSLLSRLFVFFFPLFLILQSYIQTGTQHW